MLCIGEDRAFTKNAVVAELESSLVLSLALPCSSTSTQSVSSGGLNQLFEALTGDGNVGPTTIGNTPDALAPEFAALLKRMGIAVLGEAAAPPVGGTDPVPEQSTPAATSPAGNGLTLPVGIADSALPAAAAQPDAATTLNDLLSLRTLKNFTVTPLAIPGNTALARAAALLKPDSPANSNSAVSELRLLLNSIAQTTPESIGVAPLTPITSGEQVSADKKKPTEEDQTTTSLLLAVPLSATTSTPFAFPAGDQPVAADATSPADGTNTGVDQTNPTRKLVGKPQTELQAGAASPSALPMPPGVVSTSPATNGPQVATGLGPGQTSQDAAAPNQNSSASELDSNSSAKRATTRSSAANQSRATSLSELQSVLQTESQNTANTKTLEQTSGAAAIPRSAHAAAISHENSSDLGVQTPETNVGTTTFDAGRDNAANIKQPHIAQSMIAAETSEQGTSVTAAFLATDSTPATADQSALPDSVGLIPQPVEGSHADGSSQREMTVESSPEENGSSDRMANTRIQVAEHNTRNSGNVARPDNAPLGPSGNVFFANPADASSTQPVVAAVAGAEADRKTNIGDSLATPSVTGMPLSAASAAPTPLNTTTDIPGSLNQKTIEHLVSTTVRETSMVENGGSQRFQMRLDPPTLGGLTIEIHRSASGTVAVHVAAASPQTHALLEQHSTEISQALTDQGLSLSQFDLSQQQQHASGDQSQQYRETLETAFLAREAKLQFSNPSSPSTSGSVRADPHSFRA